MSRPFRARVLAAVLVSAAAGCQDYNFNPVGHCVLQPGNQRFTLSNVSSADVLFVVDDSGSMAGEQDRLAAAFADFVENLTSTNRGRAQGGLLPLDFHVAVTTSSIFVNREPIGSIQTCSAACVPGKLACCAGNQPVYGPRPCSTAGARAPECPVQGPIATSCRNTCDGYKGTYMCCAADDSFPANAVDGTVISPGVTGGKLVECQREGTACGKLETQYDFGGVCNLATKGVGEDGYPLPDGAFVGSTNLSTVQANPRVLHFDKRLYLSSQGRNAQGFTMDELMSFFRQNVQVGTCGSQQEQGLQASRRALERAFARLQQDVYDYDWVAGATSGVSSAAPMSFTAPARIPTPGKTAAWPNPNPNSKLVVVYVGDEDDCSSPKDPAAGVLLLDNDAAGADACTRDATERAPLGGKQYAVSSFVNYLTGLGRPVGAAFVVSARASNDDSTCSGADCFADKCCDRACTSAPPYNLSNVCSFDVCGGQAPGTRFIEAATQLRAKGADVVVGSVCGDFRPLLREVAEIVKPPQTLSLPSVPAESAIAILRIASSSGETRKICGRPLAPRQPDNYTRQEAEALGAQADWWFVPTADAAAPYDPTGLASVSVPSKFVYINPRGACIANPGETYSLDYLGVVPAGGCIAQTGDADPGPDAVLGTPDDRVLGSADCQIKMGGRFSDWQCYVPPGLTTGTCTCRSGS